MAQQPQPMSDAIIRVRDITVQFGATRVLDGFFAMFFAAIGM